MVFSISNKLLNNLKFVSLKSHNRSFSFPRKQFIDKVVIELQGGRGGNGCISHSILSPVIK